LAPEPGERVLDMCAAPGGKAMAIAERVGSSGTVVAVEISPERCERLRQNIVRVGLDNVEIVQADARTYSSERFDRVLCDAPCSASGLLRKQPDVRWRRRSHHLPLQYQQQLELLTHAASLTKPGGVLVYSTCSIFPTENYDVVSSFLKAHPDFYKEDARGYFREEIVGAHGDMETFTHIQGTDGGYAARLRRSPKVE
jgi:16S rRNA (cytosine967-C5)-methyltransferase